MSFKTNQNQQLTLSDRFINSTPGTQKIVLNSWSRDFADMVFPSINEERFAVLYSSMYMAEKTLLSEYLSDFWMSGFIMFFFSRFYRR